LDLLKASNGVVPPLNAFIGGIATQEVLKACTGKFTPLNQWLLYSARDCAPNSGKTYFNFCNFFI
jgi:ubiquitin-activating enzyme E1